MIHHNSAECFSGRLEKHFISLLVVFLPAWNVEVKEEMQMQ